MSFFLVENPIFVLFFGVPMSYFFDLSYYLTPCHNYPSFTFSFRRGFLCPELTVKLYHDVYISQSLEACYLIDELDNHLPINRFNTLQKHKLDYLSSFETLYYFVCDLKLVVQSSVIATPQDPRTRQDKIHEERKSKEGKDRYRTT